MQVGVHMPSTASRTQDVFAGLDRYSTEPCAEPTTTSISSSVSKGAHSRHRVTADEGASPCTDVTCASQDGLDIVERGMSVALAAYDSGSKLQPTTPTLPATTTSHATSHY